VPPSLFGLEVAPDSGKGSLGVRAASRMRVWAGIGYEPQIPMTPLNLVHHVSFHELLRTTQGQATSFTQSVGHVLPWPRIFLVLGWDLSGFGLRATGRGLTGA
jgi:hypothetical protein